MDGNGRWAQAQGLSRSAGHAAGAESVRACMRAAVKSDVKYLSLYTFSQENWNRPEKEVAAIMDLMSYNIRKELPEFHENKVGFKVIGDMGRLTPRLRKEIEAAEAETAQYKRDFGTPAQKPLESYLATAGIPDPDLLIRTGGEQRISNYMLWQCAYTEFYFTDKLWPDFREDDFNEALDSFKGRDRRFGKVKQ